MAESGYCTGCNCGIIWSVVEIICGIAFALSGILAYADWVGGGDYIPVALVATAMILAGILVILYALGYFVIDFVKEWMKFYTTFLGRGITFILLGIIGWRGFSDFFLLLFIVQEFLGCLYVVFNFVPGVPPPSPICGGDGKASTTTTTEAATSV